MHDLDFVLKILFERYPNANFYLAGSSFGACIGIRYLTNFDHNKRIKGMYSLSNPFDIFKSANNLNTWSYMLYGKFMTKNLVKKTNSNHKMIKEWEKENNIDLDFDNLFKVKSTFEYDEKFTFKIHKNSDHRKYYYDTISCATFIDKIDVPVLFLHSRNDPICPFFLIELNLCLSKTLNKIKIACW